VKKQSNKKPAEPLGLQRVNFTSDGELRQVEGYFQSSLNTSHHRFAELPDRVH
jgi:hypothetical protein